MDFLNPLKTKTDPTITVELDSFIMPEDLQMRLKSWTYEDHNKMSKLVLRFDNYDLEILDDLLEPGVPVSFIHGYTSGYVSKKKYFIINKNSGWREPIIEGFELVQFFNVDPQNRGWTHKPLETIIGQIAAANKLKPDVEPLLYDDGTPVFLTILQAGMEDLAFLWSLAKKIGYEVFIEEGKLIFKTRQNLLEPYMAFFYDGLDGDVLDFNPKVTTLQKRSAVKGKGINRKKPKATATFTFVKDAEKKTNRGSYVSSKGVNYDKIAKRYKIRKNPKVYGKPLRDVKDAENSMIGAWIDMTKEQITADLTVIGEPALERRKVIYVGGIGKYSGNYYVEGVTHSSEGGYVSIAKLVRNAYFDLDFKNTEIHPLYKVNVKKPSKKEYLKTIEKNPDDRIFVFGKI
jgi:phage protein D